jgi:hypothetical protein
MKEIVTYLARLSAQLDWEGQTWCPQWSARTAVADGLFASFDELKVESCVSYSEHFSDGGAEARRLPAAAC